jgi:hypothetical protein
VVGESDLVVGQLLVEVPDLDDLPTSIFLLSKIKYFLTQPSQLTIKSNPYMLIQHLGPYTE